MAIDNVESTLPDKEYIRALERKLEQVTAQLDAQRQQLAALVGGRK